MHKLLLLLLLRLISRIMLGSTKVNNDLRSLKYISEFNKLITNKNLINRINLLC